MKHVLQILPFCALVLSGAAAQAQNAALQDTPEFATCFAQDDRIRRLICYDDLFGRPAERDLKAAVVPAPVTPTLPAAVERSWGLLQSATITPEGVAVTIIDRETGKKAIAGPDGFLAEIDPPTDSEAFDDFKSSYDLKLALPSQPASTEPGVLLLSCENNITSMKVLWTTQSSSRFETTRFHAGQNLSDAARDLLTLRTEADGYLLAAPRGLESIRLVQALARGADAQITIGDGVNVRSLFFDAQALRAALPLIARQCSWSVQTFQTE